MKVGVSVALTALTAAFLATEARAELVYLSSGRTLSVRSVRMESDCLVLVLRGGGEIACDPSLISRVAPDEVPYAADAPVTADPGEVKADLGGAKTDLAEVNAGGSVRYAAIIDRVAKEHGVDATLVRAVIQVESGYDERA